LYVDVNRFQLSVWRSLNLVQITAAMIWLGAAVNPMIGVFATGLRMLQNRILRHQAGYGFARFAGEKMRSVKGFADWGQGLVTPAHKRGSLPLVDPPQGSVRGKGREKGSPVAP
jgi:hypothetical protein